MTNQAPPRWRDMFMDCEGLTLEQLEPFGDGFALYQKSVNWWIGDVARYAEEQWPDRWQQVFPEWMSPGLVSRCAAVAKAYPREEDRNPNATWTIHMQSAKHEDRIARVASHVDEGRTSDEARVADRETRWLLAIDVNYYIHRFWHSGASVEAASSVVGWIQRTVDRLKGKGLTDVACCFDSPRNHRKELTQDWEHRYKDRPRKEPELAHQITTARELLFKAGFCCVAVDGMEGDDVMASYAKQFPGRVTLVTQDKDCRQCLSATCNMLLDVNWHESDGRFEPEYQWLSAKKHTEETGIPPSQWTELQMLMGDPVDGIKGAVGIGEKGAKDLIREFGCADGAVQAAKEGHYVITEKRRESLLAFESVLETTRKLVTLRTDLALPAATRV